MKGKILIAVAVAAVATVGGATYAIAASSGSPTYYGCVANADGKLRVVATADACKNGESAITWNAEGPAGAAGAPGRDGRDGRDAAGAADPLTATMDVTGQKQGSFSTSISGYSHSIVSPRDAASGLPTGKRQYKPITITKEWDATSPLLLTALTRNENLPTVLITISKGGSPVAKVKLTNANIASYNDTNTVEQWSFTFQKIEWTWLDGGITAEDDWEAPAV